MSKTAQQGFIDVPADPDSAWWWQALYDHRLLVPRCLDCGRSFFPPQPTCPYCGSRSWEPVESSGAGRLYSWIVVNLALSPEFQVDAPYTIVAVELDEGVRLLGRLIGDAEPVPDLRLVPRFYAVAGRTLLGFERPIQGDTATP